MAHSPAHGSHPGPGSHASPRLTLWPTAHTPAHGTHAPAHGAHASPQLTRQPMAPSMSRSQTTDLPEGQVPPLQALGAQQPRACREGKNRERAHRVFIKQLRP